MKVIPFLVVSSCFGFFVAVFLASQLPFSIAALGLVVRGFVAIKMVVLTWVLTCYDIREKESSWVFLLEGESVMR